MRVAVRLVGKRADHHERRVVSDADDRGSRTLHLAGVGVIVVLQFLYVFAVRDELVARRDRSLEDVIFTHDFDRGVVRELDKPGIAVVVNARLVSETGIARTPFESVV